MPGTGTLNTQGATQKDDAKRPAGDRDPKYSHADGYDLYQQGITTHIPFSPRQEGKLYGDPTLAAEKEGVLVTSSDGLYTYKELSDGSARVFSYEGEQITVSVPQQIDGHQVVAIASKCFNASSDLIEVTLPDSVRQMGFGVFSDCRSLAKVTLSDSLMELESTSFSRCTSLAQVHLPASIETIEGHVFSASPIEHLQVGPALSSISMAAFDTSAIRELSVDASNPFFSTDGVALFTADGEHLVNIVVNCETYRVPEGCRFIDEKAFDSAVFLKHVELPTTLESIARFAFAKSGLEEIDIPASVRSIGEKAFFNCEHLRKLVVHEGLESIGEEALSKTKLLSVDLPASLAEMGNHAFRQTDIQFEGPDCTFCIAAGNPVLFFDGKGGLYLRNRLIELLGDPTTYTVRAGTERIAANAARWHENLETVVFNADLKVIGNNAFRMCRKLKHADLPDSVVRIGEGAFMETDIDKMRISANVVEIGNLALQVQGTHMPVVRGPLLDMQLDPANARYYCDNGLLCERRDPGQGDKALLFTGSAENVVIPDAVTQVDSFAFFAARPIQNLTLHSKVQRIGISAFFTQYPIKNLHIDFPREVDGFDHDDIIMPDMGVTFGNLMQAITIDDDGLIFNYRFYDSKAACPKQLEDIARIPMNRLLRPIKLSSRSASLYRSLLKRNLNQVCGWYAERGKTVLFDELADVGVLNAQTIDGVIEYVSDLRVADATAYLLELKQSRFGMADLDFSL